MLPLASLKNRHIAVLGLGVSGKAALETLSANGAQIVAWDDDPEQRRKINTPHITMADLSQYDFSEISELILSPGIPFRHPQPHPAVSRAQKAGCRIINETELLSRLETPPRMVGITGTNGKSTTTSLIAHSLKTNHIQAVEGGNLGTPACQLPPLPADGVYVLEMSSYQLDLLDSLTFDIAILLNISPDHLEHHGGWEGYIEAKKRIFYHQPLTASAIIGIDDPGGQTIYRELLALNRQSVIPVSATIPCPGGIYLDSHGWLIDDTKSRQTAVCKLESIPALQGSHNGQNAAAAYATCQALGLTDSQICSSFSQFPGLPHRQQKIATIAGIDFINDSKATNPQSCLQALSLYEDIYWIAGGQAKENSLGNLETCLGSVRKVYLIGAASSSFASILKDRVEVALCGDLATATEQAFTDAQKDKLRQKTAPVILLSPACASFDQWKNFEERGQAFQALVLKLQDQHHPDYRPSQETKS